MGAGRTVILSFAADFVMDVRASQRLSLTTETRLAERRTCPYLAPAARAIAAHIKEPVAQTHVASRPDAEAPADQGSQAMSRRHSGASTGGGRRCVVR
jgi:hypothetical protein